MSESSTTEPSSSSNPEPFRPDRRQFLRLAAAGSAAAFLPGCADSSTPAPTEEPEPTYFFKDTTPFTQHGNTNLETKLEDLGGFITPNELFFVRNNSSSIAVDVDTYKLVVEGDAIATPLELSYADLLNLPSRTVFSYIECGGNQRSFFGEALNAPAQGTQWRTGGVGMAIWTGVPLNHVLSMAGIRDTAVDIQFIGLDTESPENGFRRSIPVDKAQDEDTLLAYRMNGALLPKDHGFPVRALVPGWVGSSNIKWLGRIVVSSERLWTRNNTTSYVLIGDAYPPEGEARGQVATLQSIKSSLMLPWPATLPAGLRMIRGYAYSPYAPIGGVEWSADGGATWQQARLIDPLMKYAWARFEFEWEAQPGSHTLITRATDQAGNTQPDTLPPNEKGYLFNLPLHHPITVHA